MEEMGRKVSLLLFLACYHHDSKDSAIVFTTGRLPDVNPSLNWSGYKRLQMQL
jgi:hypothetical protein